MYQTVLYIYWSVGSLFIPLVYSAVPETSFSCENRIAGYYADPETGCQSYHMCDSRARKYSYLCPNLTLFHQKFMVCDHWKSVECQQSEEYYFLNEEIAGLRVQDANDVDIVKQSHSVQGEKKNKAQSGFPKDTPSSNNEANADLSLPGIRVENAVKTKILDEVVGSKSFSPSSDKSSSSQLKNFSSSKKIPIQNITTTEAPKTSLAISTTTDQTTTATPTSKPVTPQRRKDTNRAFFSFTKATPISLLKSTNSVTTTTSKPITQAKNADDQKEIKVVSDESVTIATISDEFLTRFPTRSPQLPDDSVTTIFPKFQDTSSPSSKLNTSGVDFTHLKDGRFSFQFDDPKPKHINNGIPLHPSSEELQEKSHTSDFYSLLGMKNFFHSTLDQLSWILPQSRANKPRLTVVFKPPSSGTPPPSPQKLSEHDHKDPSGKHGKPDINKHKNVMKFQLKSKANAKNAHCPECHPSFIVSDCFPCISIR